MRIKRFLVIGAGHDANNPLPMVDGIGEGYWMDDFTDRAEAEMFAADMGNARVVDLFELLAAQEKKRRP